MRAFHRAGMAAAVVAGALFLSTVFASTVFASTVAARAASNTPAGTGTSPVGGAPAVPFGARAQGAAPTDEQLAFDVALRPRNQAALDAFVTAVSTPGSSAYRQFLAPGEFASRFGPTPATIASVTSSLRSLGLTVGAAQGSLLPVSGSLTKVSSALHTTFNRYRLASGRIARTNVTAPRLPTSIAAAVQGVVGLDDLAQFHHPVPTATDSAAVVAPALGPNLTGPQTTCIPAGSATSGYYTADQLAAYYGLSSSYTAGTRGAGVTVALFELEPFDPADVAAYQSCYGTSTTVSTTNIDGGPGTGTGGGEAALDIEDIIGLAPDAAIQVYQGPDASAPSTTQANVLDVYTRIATDDSAQVVSTSWGLCEANATSSFMNSERTIFQQMAAQGQTVFAASGDAGSADCDTDPPPNTAPNTPPGLAVDDPASQPEVTGVGGTDLMNVTGPEVTWNDHIVRDVNGDSTISAGGGGQSKQWQMPAWQTALGVITGSSGTPCVAPSGTFCREVPDVSASADPNHGYPIYWDGGWLVFGGTSAAAPTWAALLALIDSSCSGNRLGLINPALYQLRASTPAAFRDITSGNNDGNGNNSGAFPAITGYDMATGLGTPNGAALGAGLCPAPAADGSGTIAVDHTAVGVSTRNTLRFTYTAPAATGLVNGELTLAIPGGWSAPSLTSSSAGYTIASAGVVVSVAGSVVDVLGVTTIAGGTVTITYGDRSGGGPGALAPGTARASTFTNQQMGTAAGTLTALAPSPQVAVGTAADGTGTLAVSPSSVPVIAPTTLVFTYTPPIGSGLTDGAMTTTVPSGWTPPQIADPTAPGYVTATSGTVSEAGMMITVSGLSIAIGGTMTITYGDTASDPGGAALPPGSPVTSTFTSQQKATATGSLTTLASSPVVLVGGGTPSGGSGGSGGSGSGGGGSGGVSPPVGPLALVRVAGADRVATSIAGSTTAFPKANTASAVVLARSDAFADALAGTPLAVGEGGPLLLTASAALDPATGAEIQRVIAPGGTVYLLGGTAALSANLATAVGQLGHPVVRVSGADRFATAVQVATLLGNPGRLFEADGTNFPDALSAGTAAAEAGGAILLTAGSSQSAATATYLAAHPAATRYAIGGPAASADRLATAYVGSDRFATSVLVAQAFFAPPLSVGLASGRTFPDALAGGSVTAMKHGPLLLVPSSGALPATVASYLTAAKASATAAWLFGGPTSVGADVFDAAAAILTPAP